MYANLNIFDKSNFRGYKIQGKIQSNFMQNALNFLVKRVNCKEKENVL